MQLQGWHSVTGSSDTFSILLCTQVWTGYRIKYGMGHCDYTLLSSGICHESHSIHGSITVYRQYSDGVKWELYVRPAGCLHMTDRFHSGSLPTMDGRYWKHNSDLGFTIRHLVHSAGSIYLVIQLLLLTMQWTVTGDMTSLLAVPAFFTEPSACLSLSSVDARLFSAAVSQTCSVSLVTTCISWFTLSSDATLTCPDPSFNSIV